MPAVNAGWPRAAYAVIGVLIVSFSVILWLTYRYVRDSYRAVGFNDGQIYQREQTMKLLERSVSIPPCRDDDEELFVEFVSVKSDSIHIRTVNERQVMFCRYGQALDAQR